MTERPPAQSTSQTLGGTTVVFGWVEEARVQEVLHASDGFQALLAITLAGVGGAAAAAVTLAAGVTHPVTLYLILAVAITITLVAGLFGAREYVRYRGVRRRLGAATAKVPVPVLLVTPGAPSFTVGGQQPFVVGGQQPFFAPSTTTSYTTEATVSLSAPIAAATATAPTVPTQDIQPQLESSETPPREEVSPGDNDESETGGLEGEA